MATGHGKKTYLKLATTVVSGQLNSVNVDSAVAADDVTPFGVEDDVSIVGIGSGAISAAGFYDTTNAATLIAMKGTSVAYEYGPVGSTTGSTKISGTCIVTAVNHSATPTGAVAIALTAKRTGAETVGSY